MLKKVLVAALIGASFASVPLASYAQRTVIIREAPPEPRQEMQPRLKRGQVWVPGHWEWRRGKYTWVKGQVMRTRPGQHWEAARWEQNNGQWVMRPGRWARGDRDGDGVPNRFDSRPNNPNRS